MFCYIFSYQHSIHLEIKMPSNNYIKWLYNKTNLKVLFFYELNLLPLMFFLVTFMASLHPMVYFFSKMLNLTGKNILKLWYDFNSNLWQISFFMFFFWFLTPYSSLYLRILTQHEKNVLSHDKKFNIKLAWKGMIDLLFSNIWSNLESWSFWDRSKTDEENHNI